MSALAALAALEATSTAGPGPSADFECLLAQRAGQAQRLGDRDDGTIQPQAMTK